MRRTSARPERAAGPRGAPRSGCAGSSKRRARRRNRLAVDRDQPIGKAERRPLGAPRRPPDRREATVGIDEQAGEGTSVRSGCALRRAATRERGEAQTEERRRRRRRPPGKRWSRGYPPCPSCSEAPPRRPRNNRATTPLPRTRAMAAPPRRRHRASAGEAPRAGAPTPPPASSPGDERLAQRSRAA